MVAAGWVTPSIPEGSILIVMSVLGAVVMPHNLFLHSEIIQSREWNLKDETVIRRQLKFEFVDTLFSMGVGWGINSAMVIIAAAAFFGRTRVTELAPDARLAVAHERRVGRQVDRALLVGVVWSRGFVDVGREVLILFDILLVVVLAQFAFPVLGEYHSTRNIAHRALELRQAGEPIVTYRFFHHTLHYYTNYQIAGKLDAPHSLVQFAREHSGCLVVTNTDGMKEILSLKDISAAPMAEQGDFCLLHITADSR